MSSANNVNSIIFEVSTISFTRIKNNKGPKIYPCGTPHAIGANFEFILFIETYCIRLVR